MRNAVSESKNTRLGVSVLSLRKEELRSLEVMLIAGELLTQEEEEEEEEKKG